MLKCRCGLPAPTAWKQLWCSNGASCCQPAPLGSSFGAQMPLRAASPHVLEAALVLKCRCGLPARTAWKQLWCSNAAAGCQPALLGDSIGAQMPLRAASQRARLRSSFGAQMPLRAASPHRLDVAFVVKCRCGLPAHAAWKHFLAQMPLRAASSHRRLEAQLGAQMLLRTASVYHVEAALVLKCRCGLTACTGLEAALVFQCRCGEPARLGSSFRAQMLLGAASPLRFGTALVLSNAAAGCQPALLGSSVGAQMPLWAASSHGLEAALVLKWRCGCQPAPPGSSFGAQMPLLWSASSHRSTAWIQFCAQKPLRATSPHRLEAGFMLKHHCWLPAAPLHGLTAWKQVWCSKIAAGNQPPPPGSRFGAQIPKFWGVRCTKLCNAQKILKILKFRDLWPSSLRSL